MDHHFFDPDGKPIGLPEWGARFEDLPGRVHAEDNVDDRATVLTVWNGFVDPIVDARLFSTVLTLPDGTTTVLEQHDDKQAALDRHPHHVRKTRERMQRATSLANYLTQMDQLSAARQAEAVNRRREQRDRDC